MHEIPTFNPHSLYPILGTAMPRTEIDAETRLPDMLVPNTDGAEGGDAFVERRLLIDLLESPAHWDGDVRQHLAFAGTAPGTAGQPFTVYMVTFNPRARLRVAAAQTFQWSGAGSAVQVMALDDPRAQVMAIDLGVDLAGHPWQAEGPVAGERNVRLCGEVGFDLSPSGRKQYWPGRELRPIVDYLPYRLLVKLAYVRHLLGQKLAASATGR